MADSEKRLDHDRALAASNGDRTALEELLVQHYPLLERTISRELAFNWPAALRAKVSVEEIVQDTLVRAIRGITTFVPDANGSFQGWIVKLAQAELVDARRRHQRIKRGGRHHRVKLGNSVSSVFQLLDAFVATDRSPRGNVALREATAAIQVGMANLPPSQREAIRLHELEGKSLIETAAILNRTGGAARGLLHRARRSLREILGRSSRWFDKK